jgi:hypothetical protein
MHYAPTNTRIEDLSKVFNVNLEEFPTAESGNAAKSYHFVARVRERPVLSRKVFKCNIHTLNSSKTLAIMKFKPYEDAQFTDDREKEAYMCLAIKTAEQVAINKGFNILRVSSPIRMIEDVMLDNGFFTVTKNSIPGSDEFVYRGCKKLN